MGEVEETYVVHKPQTDDPMAAVDDIVRQLNAILLRIAERIAEKADA